jgi:hypothetical protein
MPGWFMQMQMAAASTYLWQQQEHDIPETHVFLSWDHTYHFFITNNC